jgi:predicted ester cyclase
MSLKPIVEKHYRNFNTHNLAAEGEIMHANVVVEAPGAPQLKGIEAFTQFAKAWEGGFPDGQLKMLNFVETGDLAIAEGTFSGTNTGSLTTPGGAIPPTGKRLQMKYCDLFRVREGKIVEHRVYFDQVEFLTQLGLMPAPGAQGGGLT